MVLPMGALGDRIGFKRLLMLGGRSLAGIIGGGVFAYRQLAYRHRVLLAIGAAMIVPATLAGIRATFVKRSIATWRWASGQR